MIGTSLAIQQLRSQIDQLAKSRASVLITGESGVGKEVVARALYEGAPHGQFVAIDCISLAENLIESELFGYEPGAFTGATRRKEGLVSCANGGMAFFDEIGDMPIALQGKLLRLLQEHEYRPLGAVRPIKANFRVVAATHRDLPAEIQEGRFREDLYYRMNVVCLHVPPLRDRREDIHPLSQHFLEKLGNTHQLGSDALYWMESYDWPGNIRQLHNCIEYVVAMSGEGLVTAADLPPWVHPNGRNGEDGRNKDSEAQFPSLSLRGQERRTIAAAIEQAQGDYTKAAKILGIGRTTLWRKLQCGLETKSAAPLTRSASAAA